MKENDFKFGIVGCGMMGKEFASAAARWMHLEEDIPKPNIVAVADPNPDSRQWFEDNIDGIKYSVSDYSELLSISEIDAIYCAVPHFLHGQIYTDIINSKKHLLGEKPFGMNMEQNNMILEAVEKNPDVFVRCSSQMPFYPACQKIIKWINEGKFGRIIEVRCGFNHSSDLNLDKPINWKRMNATNGEYGCMGDLGIHTQHVPFRMGFLLETVYAQLSNIVETRNDGKGGVVKCDTWDNATLNCNVRMNDFTLPLILETKRISPGSTNNWYIEIFGMESSAKFSTDDPNALYYTVENGSEQAWCRLNIGNKPQIKTITGSIFEFGFSDAILQMWAVFMKELSGDIVEFGCFRPEETRISHKLQTAALESNKNNKAVAIL